MSRRSISQSRPALWRRSAASRFTGSVCASMILYVGGYNSARRAQFSAIILNEIRLSFTLAFVEMNVRNASALFRAKRAFSASGPSGEELPSMCKPIREFAADAESTSSAKRMAALSGFSVLRLMSNCSRLSSFFSTPASVSGGGKRLNI